MVRIVTCVCSVPATAWTTSGRQTSARVLGAVLAIVRGGAGSDVDPVVAGTSNDAAAMKPRRTGFGADFILACIARTPCFVRDLPSHSAAIVSQQSATVYSV